MPEDANALARNRREFDTNLIKPFLQSVGSYQPDFIYGAESDLVHYTDLNGLRGILSTHDLWLTHSQYCNDDEEMVHGYRIAEQVVGRCLATPTNDDHRDFLLQVQSLLKHPVDVYFCCFCRNDDLLSQWRSYGANGTGVCLRLNPTDFADLTGPDSPPGGLMRLWKVFYDTNIQEQIIQMILQHGFNSGGSLQDRAEGTSAAIQFFVPTFKNSGFQEENECRLIFTPSINFSLPPQFRVGRGMLIPYYSLAGLQKTLSTAKPKLPLTGIKIGPSAHKGLNKVSVEMMLKASAVYAGIPVECSNIPYRG